MLHVLGTHTGMFLLGLVSGSMLESYFHARIVAKLEAVKNELLAKLK